MVPQSSWGRAVPQFPHPPPLCFSLPAMPQFSLWELS